MITEVLAKTDPVTTNETPKGSATATAKAISPVVKKAESLKTIKSNKPANRSTGKTKV
jgi:hypothetical protein